MASEYNSSYVYVGGIASTQSFLEADFFKPQYRKDIKELIDKWLSKITDKQMKKDFLEIMAKWD